MGWGVASRVYSPAHAASGWCRGWERGGPEAGTVTGGWGRELALFPGLSDGDWVPCSPWPPATVEPTRMGALGQTPREQMGTHNTDTAPRK